MDSTIEGDKGKDKENTENQDIVPEQKGPARNMGSVFMSLGLDTEKFGPGKIMLVAGGKMNFLTYLEVKQICEFINEEKAHCNKQMKAEIAKLTQTVPF